ncbi:MAG: hypothetical protein HY864_11325 [Chloroflexi bacterium]|nr:hypothetical protein [Chloroflexota bacterium]
MKNLHRISILYLTLPFIIFCLGWLRLSVAIPIVIILLFALWQLLKNANPITNYQLPNFFSLTTVYCLLITGLWVFFSGVGGYAFQNWDHHWRNAVLRDLITYNWPVIYSSPDTGPIKMLVYYVGYWLPSALVGKVFGWEAANFLLFLWTWFGVFLVVLHLGKGAATAPLRTIQYTFLIILFSGMDSLGVLLFAKDYPTLWPPVQHLEVWSGALQYSSFTTQLFWVFNQAVPAWLCIALILENNVNARRVLSPTKQSPVRSVIASGEERPRNDMKIFLWSLCFFFAPLASVGLLPYLLVDLIKQTDFKSPFKHLRFDLLAAASIIFLLSYFFFSSNTAAQQRGFHPLAVKDFLAFFLLEGGVLWVLLAVVRWRDPRWIVTGALLFILPFIQLGSGNDFVMRASIAPMFCLMMMTGEVIFQPTSSRILRFTLYVLLLFGSLTPLYEINRSIDRTYQYMTSDSPPAQSSSEPLTHLAQGTAPELEHPNSLIADEIKTLAFMDDKLSKNFIANVRQSLYYRYISSR